jgi:hypothetical protein
MQELCQPGRLRRDRALWRVVLPTIDAGSWWDVSQISNQFGEGVLNA